MGGRSMPSNTPDRRVRLPFRVPATPSGGSSASSPSARRNYPAQVPAMRPIQCCTPLQRAAPEQDVDSCVNKRGRGLRGSGARHSPHHNRRTQRVRDKAVSVGLRMQRCKLMFARRISKRHLRMQDDLCEATNPIRIRCKRALGRVYISRYHHT
jgi:hypothetical protein